MILVALLTLLGLLAAEPVVKEEIRIRKDTVQEQEVVQEDVRKEEVDVDDATGRRGGPLGHDADDETKRRGR